MKHVATFFLLASLGACALSGSEPERDEPLAKPGQQFVARRGGGCLGTCSDYDVYVFSDGLVKFRGNAYTAARGVRIKRIPREKYEIIVHAISTSRFFEREAETVCLTDQSAIVVEANFQGVLQRKLIDSGCNSNQENFWPIAELIVQAADVDRWIARHRTDWY